jgi:hypothetical protein
MMQNHNALSAKVLKVVYFSETTLLQTRVGPAASQVQRAIHEGVQVLKQGLIHRIGTRENTGPWNDNLLPRKGLLRPLACLVEKPPLIDVTTTM